MNRRWYLAAGLVAACSTLALAAPESLLPPAFDRPATRPTATPTPSPSAPPARPPRPGATSARPAVANPAASPGSGAAPVIQPLPSPVLQGSTASPPGIPGLANLPTLAELEAMDPDELDAALGLQPKFDIPPAARRAVAEVGLLSTGEGGFASGSLVGQPAGLIRAALAATRGPLVSRWGHILLRRALASRLDAPRGMDPVSFVALRAALLGRMGEAMAARAMVQDVDSANYNRPLADAAFAAYLGTGDLLGMCPIAQVRGDLRDDAEWEMMQAICDAFSGDDRGARRRLDRALGTGQAPAIDVRLAQRFAGAAGEGARAVNIEWAKVDALTPWRHSLARALGVDLPESLTANAGPRYDLADVLIPAVPLAQRMTAADRAGRSGVLSSAAMVDLYSQAYASGATQGATREAAQGLRAAYVGGDPAARLAAIRTLWGNADNAPDYGRQVLTAFAAARLPVSDALVDAAPGLLASMLSAGLDANARRWAGLIDEGTPAWGLLVFAQASGAGQVSGGSLSDFYATDTSDDHRKSQFLLAGLAGLGRLTDGAVADLADDFGVDFQRPSAWSLRIDRAGQLRNGALVALLAGLGMQGDGWDKMTARHLFHIVRALDQAGLDAEARMIAAEAVARA